MIWVRLAEPRIPEVGEEVGIYLDGVPWEAVVEDVEREDQLVRVTLCALGGGTVEAYLVTPV